MTIKKALPGDNLDKVRFYFIFQNKKKEHDFWIRLSFGYFWLLTF
jgi:hypothetical protein